MCDIIVHMYVAVKTASVRGQRERERETEKHSAIETRKETIHEDL